MRVYFIRKDTGVELLWNRDEAYLFISVVPRGFHVRYVGSPFVWFSQFLYAVPSTDDERISVTVIRVTQSSVESHVVAVVDNGPGSIPDSNTPIEGHIYANYPGLGGRSRWFDDRFVAANEAERQRLGDIDHLTTYDIDNVNGWSVKNEATSEREYPRMSINLLRPGRAPERLWYLDGSPHRVSRSVYERTFKGPS